MTWLDLALFTGAVYGIARVVTQSELMSRPRDALAGVPLVGKAVSCLVCTAGWTSLVGMALLPTTTVFSDGFRMRSAADMFVLGGWVVASTWALGMALGDVD